MQTVDAWLLAKEWSWKRGTFWATMSAVLFLSWVAPVTSDVWEWIDSTSFRLLNATVAWNEATAIFWAVTGDRRFDYASAVVFLALFIHFVAGRGEVKLRWGLAFGAYCGLLLLLVVGLQRELVAWPRQSPSIYFPSYHSIADFVPWSAAKEGSGNSFPGDHTTVMMILTVLWWRGVGWRLGLLAAIATVLFSLPRLAAGAHWVTDSVVGGGCVALLVLAIVNGTPVGWWLYRPLRRMVDRVVDSLLRTENRLSDPTLGKVDATRQVLRGLCIGAADLVPGVSGGTMALILGIYTRLIRALSRVDRRFLQLVLRGRLIEALQRVDVVFILPLLLGVGGALVFFSRVIPLPILLRELPEIMFGLFFGLIAASIMDLYGRLRSSSSGGLAWIALGVLLGLAVVTLVPVDTPDDVWFIVLCGMIAVLAMMIPGVSGAFVLLVLGKYATTIDAIGRLDFGFLIPLAVGVGIGAILFSRGVYWLLRTFYRQTLFTVIGILGGSLLAVWPFQDRQYEMIGDKLRLISSEPYLPDRLDLWEMFAILAMLIGIAVYRVIARLAQKSETAD